ncbi:type II secretion system protein [Duganella sp.]|uniref:type II secretion system protein n=1 Tax=Duganella sp. TaxID=1904440 RepID=UPI0031DF62CF
MKSQRGFTLIEGIVVMVITAILAGIMVLFIRRPVQSYIDSAERADMADVADIALRRMTRELHGAVPNSIRWLEIGNTTLLEFIPTKAGGIYLSEEDAATAPPLPAPQPAPLSFTSTTAVTFDIVGPVPAAPYAIAPGDSIIVYNLGNEITDADAYSDGDGTVNGVNRGTVQSVVGNRVTISDPNWPLPNTPRNPFAVPAANNRVASTSPGKRFTVATDPVTFACVNDTATGRGTLTRIWGYGFVPVQAAPPNTARRALMAANVYACRFSVQQMANQNTALIGLSIALARSSAGASANGLETVTLSHQIHVENTP